MREFDYSEVSDRELIAMASGKYIMPKVEEEVCRRTVMYDKWRAADDKRSAFLQAVEILKCQLTKSSRQSADLFHASPAESEDPVSAEMVASIMREIDEAANIHNAQDNVSIRIILPVVFSKTKNLYVRLKALLDGQRFRIHNNFGAGVDDEARVQLFTRGIELIGNQTNALYEIISECSSVSINPHEDGGVVMEFWAPRRRRDEQ